MTARGAPGQSALEPNRRKTVLSMLDQHHKASIEQLEQWLGVSASTVRRDIAWLAEHKMLLRVRGGAQRLPPAGACLPLQGKSFSSNLARQGARKRAIARHAASLCIDGETVIINGGSTTYMMNEFLAPARLRIMTNSFLMAQRLLSSSENEVFLPGGHVYREQDVILSPFETDIMRHHCADKMFMGITGISALGLMESDLMLIQAERRLIGQADQLIVLADSSKFSQRTGLILCALSQVNMVITDREVEPGAVRMLRDAGVSVVIVDAEHVD